MNAAHPRPAPAAGALRNLLCAGLLAASLPASATLIDKVSNDYLLNQLSGPDDTFLISSVHQKAGTAWIRSDLRTMSIDRSIRVHWTDHRGQTILNHDGVGFDFRTWITLDTEWVGVFFGQPAYDEFQGQADFTGWQLVRFPCNSRICNTEHLDWLKNAPPPGPGAPDGSRMVLDGTALADGFEGVTATRARLASLTEDPSAPDDADLATRADLAGFESSVEAVAGGWRYRYTATNGTEGPADFDFGLHGFAGTLDAGTSETVEFDSAQAPTLRRVTANLAGNDALALDYRLVSGAVGLEVLTPVPEPAPAALLLAGLATLAWRLRQRCGRDGG